MPGTGLYSASLPPTFNYLLLLPTSPASSPASSSSPSIAENAPQGLSVSCCSHLSLHNQQQHLGPAAATRRGEEQGEKEEEGGNQK